MNKGFPTLNRNSSITRSKSIEPYSPDPASSNSRKQVDIDTILANKTRDIKKLEEINKQLVIGQQKRDEIIASALEENRKLKENIRWYQRLLAQTKKQMKAHESSPSIKTKPLVSNERSPRKLERKIEKVNTFDVMSKHLDKTPQEEQEFARLNRLIDNMTENYDGFIERFDNLDSNGRRDFIDAIKVQKEEFQNITNLALRLRRLVHTLHKVSTSLVLTHAIERLVNETCETLNCDRASVYLVDELNNELWTKVPRGSEGTIRIPLDKGIMGYVAITGNALNIEDAYKDSRFNKAVDIQTNYRTKTILAIPIRDISGNLIGVAQAVNKQGGIFTPDDQVLFELLSNHAGVLLKNNLQNETSLLMYHKMEYALEAFTKLASAASVRDLVLVSQQSARQILSAEKAYLFLHKENKIIRYTEQGEEIFEDNIGLVGKCISERKKLNIPDAYNDPSFNFIVDIQTSMPVLCLPLKINSGEVIAVLEVVNAKGIQGRSSTNKAKLNQVDHGILQRFREILRISITHKLGLN
jgi:GAF domain-containing protein